MIIFKILICIFCILWVVLSIYKQLNPKAFNKYHDPFSLIPIWTLFSPSPLKNRCLLGYREKTIDGKVSGIIITEYFSPKWYYTLWYGQRRDVKFFLGIRRQLLLFRKNPNAFKTTLPFLLIENYIKNYKNDEIKERQIIYFKKGGFRIQKNDEILFVTKIILC